MSSSYVATPSRHAGPRNWMVYHSGEARRVVQDLPQAHAITLATILNHTADALKVAWWEARKEPPRTRRDR